jgi:hypothetical protein
MMVDAKAGEGRQWEAGWEGHQIAQRRRLARLPMTEKLRWLEEAHRLVLHLGRSRDRSEQG